MKKFARHKTHDEIRKQCAEQGVRFNDHLYRTAGWDTVVLGDQLNKTTGHVIYNTFNGRFHGEAPWPRYTDEKHGVVAFSSDDQDLDGTPWFDELLIFFYIER